MQPLPLPSTHTPLLQLSVTVPNAYNENTKEEIKTIFEAAGLPKKKLLVLNESLAGMLGYIRESCGWPCVTSS